MEVHRTEANMIEGEIESVLKLYLKMRENIVEATVAGDFYRLLKGMQEISDVVGVSQISQIRVSMVDSID